LNMMFFLLGCGLSELLPSDPVVVGSERDNFDQLQSAGVIYTGAPKVPFPVIPLQVWGLKYGLDVVLRTTDPEWDMHEYARIDLPSGSIWVAKDADSSRILTITAPIDGITSWVPEAPVDRVEGALEVVDASEGENVDLSFRYTNPKSQPVEVHVTGKLPKKPASKRNGNTMGHSRNSVAALLDLYLFGPAKTAEIKIDGEEKKIKRVFGLYPMQILLAQTQGGVAIADAHMAASPEGFLLTRPGPAGGLGGAGWPTQATEHWAVAEDGTASTANPVTRLVYRFVNGELVSASVFQAGDPVPVTHLAFRPAIPDLRRPFAGVATSRFAVDISGQKGHGLGQVNTSWVDANTVRIDFIPLAPRWFADRPMQGTLRYLEDGVDFSMVRVGD
jgi:hypothetical protein